MCDVYDGIINYGLHFMTATWSGSLWGVNVDCTDGEVPCDLKTKQMKHSDVAYAHCVTR